MTNLFAVIFISIILLSYRLTHATIILMDFMSLVVMGVKHIYYVIFFLFFAGVVNASVPVDDMISKCTITPTFKVLNHQPGKFSTTNNLRKSPGSFETSSGKKIVIFGRIMDKNCVPISDATIKIWQTDSQGNYIWLKHSSENNNFVGSGIMNSDNMGRFYFLSVMPGKFKSEDPHINFLIEHPNLGMIKTKLYFADTKNINERLRAVKLLDKDVINNFQDVLDNLSTKNDIYFFDIVVNKSQKHKRY